MGATVSTGKLACAFMSTRYNIMYVLFEETYEKNCYPHTPQWSCNYVGQIEGALKRIFLRASSCEGGMLQNRNGTVTPEGYISKWLAEMANPVRFQNETIDLQLGDSFYATVPRERLATVEKCLATIGNTTLLPQLNSGQAVSLDLYNDAELIESLFGIGPLSPWRILRHGPQVVRDDSLGYKPRTTKNINIAKARFLKLDQHERLKQCSDGTWKHVGWEYSEVGSYIAQYYKTEMAEPGSYHKRIKAYRDEIRSAVDYPEGLKAQVDLTVGLDDEFDRKSVASFLTKYQVTTTTNGYEVSVTPEQIYDLKCLPQKCVTWIVPQTMGQTVTAQSDLLSQLNVA